VSTLEAEPWLAGLGGEPLGPRLAACGRALREHLEFARLTARQPLYVRAWRDAGAVSATALWARRARYRLGGHCLVVQEVFLPRVLQ
jgi:chorismate-pyruvate lyase